MPEEKTSLRIPKAAIEFNVSQERIIDILTKHGFEIKSLSAKLSAEMYDCLLGELAKDKMVKEKIRTDGASESQKRGSQS